MSGVGLFAIGAVVTLIVMTAIVLLCYAAVMDGRHVRDEHLRAEERDQRAAEAAEAASAV